MKVLPYLAAVLFSLAAAAAPAAGSDDSMRPPAPLNEQAVTVSGDRQRPIELEATIFTPPGAGPFPLVIMNHGAAGTTRPDLEPRYRYTFSAFYFLSRGYAVVLPMMRGYAGSRGHQDLNGCNQEAVGLANARDIRGVIEAVSTLPNIDGKRVVVAGQSFGGWNTLAFGTLHDPNVKGLINFSGGAVIGKCSDTPGALARAAQHYGEKTGIPSIWFYGDNDSKFPPAVWRDMFTRYNAAGGHAELVAVGNFMTDSHAMIGYPESLGIWTPKVDAFLEKIGLPGKEIFPEYLPTAFPPPSHYAAIGDVDAIPYISDKGRQEYRKFLAAPMPRVFVISPSGTSGAFNGGFDPVVRAKDSCAKLAQNCQIYAVDNLVTWTRPTPAPPPTKFAPLDDAAALPYLNDAGREGYRKYLTMRKPKAFVIASDGAWAASSQGDDPLAGAMQACTKAHAECAYYAVDDAVVWSAVQRATDPVRH
jgi:dienelactone hydrolase